MYYFASLKLVETCLQTVSYVSSPNYKTLIEDHFSPLQIENQVDSNKMNRRASCIITKDVFTNYKKCRLLETKRKELATIRKWSRHEELFLIDIIENKHLIQIRTDREINVEYINCFLHSIAVTLKQHLNEVNLKPTEPKQNKTAPKWVQYLHEKMKCIRKLIPHTELIAKCKGTNIFTDNQQNALKILWKKIR